MTEIDWKFAFDFVTKKQLNWKIKQAGKKNRKLNR